MCDWTGPFGSYDDYKMPFSCDHQRLLKTHRFIIYKNGNDTAHLGPHYEVTGRERESAQGEGSDFIGVKGF